MRHIVSYCYILQPTPTILETTCYIRRPNLVRILVIEFEYKTQILGLLPGGYQKCNISYGRHCSEKPWAIRKLFPYFSRMIWYKQQCSFTINLITPGWPFTSPFYTLRLIFNLYNVISTNWLIMPVINNKIDYVFRCRSLIKFQGSKL